MIAIRIINYNTNEHKDELKLRDEVLRKPLGLSVYNDNLDREKDDIHIGAFSDDKLVGVLILTELNLKEIQMRQLAVNENFRLRRIGLQLVDFSESFCKLNGYETIKLNARKSAVAFYLRLGYLVASEEFFEIGIPHLKMEKKLF